MAQECRIRFGGRGRLKYNTDATHWLLSPSNFGILSNRNEINNSFCSVDSNRTRPIIDRIDGPDIATRSETRHSLIERKQHGWVFAGHRPRQPEQF